jgi:hypothetical protein
VARSIALCEADNEVQRIKEELELLPREMSAHLQHLQQLLTQQEGIEAALLAAQESPSSPRLEAATGLAAAGTLAAACHIAGQAYADMTLN